MLKSFKRWIYHASKQPKIINSDQYEEFEALGWADSPAKFAKIADFGVDADNAEQVQILGEAIEGVKDAANGALNIDVMSKKQLEDYAKKNFNVDIDRRKGIKQLRKQVKEMVGA